MSGHKRYHHLRQVISSPVVKTLGDIICFRGKIEWLPLKLIHSALFLSLIMLFCNF